MLRLMVLITLVLLAAQPAVAQNYSFSVPQMRVEAFIQPDGSVRFRYAITFENNAFASAIDIVDIGTPNGDYDLDNWSGDRDGVPIRRVATSSYIDTGVEVHLANPIDGGETGTLNVEFSMPPGLLYQDVTRDGYVSFQMTPTWFDESVVNGRGQLQIAIHMLPGISPEELLFQDRAFSDRALFQDRAVAVWTTDNWGADGAYRVGVSFPDRGLTGGVRTFTVIDLTSMWLENNPGVRFLLGLASFLMIGFAFLRFSGGTGLVVAVALLGGTAFLLFVFPLAALLLIPVALAAVIWVELSRRRKSKAYLPPIVQVEGGGIKRGLTAPEAAVILEEPLGKVLTLVIFGLLKKGALNQVEAAPLRVELNEAYRNTDTLARREAAQKAGVVLHDYELPFLDVVAKSATGDVSKLDFHAALRAVINSAVERMRGFDLSDTQAYYRQIIKRALLDAQGLGDLQVREQTLDKNLEWVLLNKDLPPTVFGGPSWTYRPSWMRPPIILPSGSFSPRPTAGSGSSGPRPSSAGGPTFGDVAGGMAGWAENTMGRLAGAILPGAMTPPGGGAGGAVDLSGFDRVTGDIFEALAKAAAEGNSSGGGRSGGGGCACACAGCACACACAGGGR
jgi:hypothetical protein